jgi:hypothetical protein
MEQLLADLKLEGPRTCGTIKKMLEPQMREALRIARQKQVETGFRLCGSPVAKRLASGKIVQGTETAICISDSACPAEAPVPIGSFHVHLQDPYPSAHDFRAEPLIGCVASAATGEGVCFNKATEPAVRKYASKMKELHDEIERLAEEYSLACPEGAPLAPDEELRCEQIKKKARRLLYEKMREKMAAVRNACCVFKVSGL